MVAIFVVLTIILFLSVDFIYQRIQKRKAAEAASTQQIYKFNKIQPITEISVPDGVFFHPGHSWAVISTDGKVRVGLDDFVNKLVGGIDTVEVRKTGTRVKQGEPLITIRKGNRVAEIAAPVDGVVEAMNATVTKNPKSLRVDPYKSGWVCALTPTNLKENLTNLNIADSAKEWARQEVDRLIRFLTGATYENKLVGQTLQDGGAPVEGVLEYMSEDAWSRFKEEFLTYSKN